MQATMAMTVALLLTCGAWMTAQGGAPTLEQAKAATYTGIYDKAITLKGGAYEGVPFAKDSPMRPRVDLIEPGMVTGDLGGDGHAEAVVLVPAW